MRTGEDKHLANLLIGNIPNPYTEGEWYPCVFPNGREGVVKKTVGRGRIAGRYYLTAGIYVPLYLREGESRRLVGTSLRMSRCNLATGEWKEIPAIDNVDFSKGGKAQ